MIPCTLRASNDERVYQMRSAMSNAILIYANEDIASVWADHELMPRWRLTPGNDACVENHKSTYDTFKLGNNYWHEDDNYNIV